MKLSSTKNFTHKARDYVSFYNEEGEPRLNVEGIVEVSGSASAGGGGFSTYSNASGDFIATANTDTNTITITGLPFTLEAKHVVGGTVKVIDASGNVSSVPTTNVTVSAGVITLGDADNFSTGDEVLVNLVGPDKAYDSASDTTQVTAINQSQYHYTDPVHILDELDQTAATYYYTPEISCDSFGHYAIQLKGSTDGSGVVFRIYGTLNPGVSTPTAGSPPSGDWVDLSSDILGAATITLDGENSDLFFIDTKTMPYKFIVSYDLDNSGNKTDVWVRKYA